MKRRLKRGILAGLVFYLSAVLAHQFIMLGG